jgi:hypothetical protein
VLLQGSSAPPTATIPRTQGSSTSPTATLACTQGLGTSLPDTLAHSYTPIVHLDPLLASIKGRSRAFMREGRAGERADEQAHSLSLASACNPYYECIPPAQDNTSHVFPLVFHLAPTHLGWDTQRQIYSSVQGPPGSERRQSLLLIKAVRGRLPFHVLSFPFRPPRKAHSHSQLPFCVIPPPRKAHSNSRLSFHVLSHSPSHKAHSHSHVHPTPS